MTVLCDTAVVSIWDHSWSEQSSLVFQESRFLRHEAELGSFLGGGDFFKKTELREFPLWRSGNESD